MTRTILGYGALAGVTAACLWLASLSPLWFDGGRELRVAVLVLAGVAVGMWFARPSTPEPTPTPTPTAQPTPTPDPPAPPPSIAQLTPRERQILLALDRGLTNKELAAELGVSENTVKTHLANLYAKLGVGRRTEALAAARANGWSTG